MLKASTRLIVMLMAFVPVSAGAVSDIEPEPDSGRNTKQEVYGQDYMVVTANPLASQAADRIIKQGGSAVDAAIAAQMVLNVVEPQSSGIGGGGFMLHYHKAEKSLTSYDGRETAPLSVKPTLFQNESGEPLPFMEAVRSGKSVGTPGLLAMLSEVHKKYGALSWEALFAPAISVAREGFNVSPRMHQNIDYVLEDDASDGFKALYLRDGKPLSVGDRFTNPAIAQVFELIAKEGIDVFYKGEIAQRIVDAVHKAGGELSAEDLASYQAKERIPVCGEYRKNKVCGMGLPSSGGVTVLQILSLLQPYDMSLMTPREMHLFLEAQKLAFADRNHYLADADFVDVPLDGLLDRIYLMKRALLIDSKNAMKTPVGYGEVGAHHADDHSYDAPSTTHISIVDKAGNAVSLTSSVEHSFGSSIVVDGFALNNQLTDFSFIAQKDGVKVANAVEAGKRPRSSMSPTMIFDDEGKLLMVLGSPGGSSIIGYVTKTIIAVLDWKLSLQQAVDFPHIINRNGVTEMEFNNKVLRTQLKAAGHDIRIKKKTSGVNAILRSDKGWIGASDPRREGIALGE